MLTSLKLLTMAGLGGAYLSVAYLAAHPRVDAEYEAHFVTRTANCWLPRALRSGDAAPSETVRIGSLDYPEACRYLRFNWCRIEDWGAWTSSDRAILRVPWKPDASAVELTLRGAAALGSPTRVQFSFNGVSRTEEVPSGALRTMVFPLSPDPARHTPDMRLTFDKSAAGGEAPSKLMKCGGDVGLVAIRYLSAPRPSAVPKSS